MEKLPGTKLEPGETWGGDSPEDMCKILPTIMRINELLGKTNEDAHAAIAIAIIALIIALLALFV